MVEWCGLAIACSYPIFDHGTLHSPQQLDAFAKDRCVCHPYGPAEWERWSELRFLLERQPPVIRFLIRFFRLEFHIKLFNIVQASDMLWI